MMITKETIQQKQKIHCLTLSPQTMNPTINFNSNIAILCSFSDLNLLKKIIQSITMQNVYIWFTLIIILKMSHHKGAFQVFKVLVMWHTLILHHQIESNMLQHCIWKRIYLYTITKFRSKPTVNDPLNVTNTNFSASTDMERYTCTMNMVPIQASKTWICLTRLSCGTLSFIEMFYQWPQTLGSV